TWNCSRRAERSRRPAGHPRLLRIRPPRPGTAAFSRAPRLERGSCRPKLHSGYPRTERISMSDKAQTDTDQPLDGGPQEAAGPVPSDAGDADWQAQVATLSAKNAELMDQFL